jgi:hypothetical protein
MDQVEELVTERMGLNGRILAPRKRSKMQRIGTVVVQITNRSGVIAAKYKRNNQYKPLLDRSFGHSQKTNGNRLNAPETQIGFHYGKL